jgi:type I restriction enzyme R subunit
VLHVAYDMPPLTRAERANRVRKSNVFTELGPVARQVIAALIDKYADSGVQTLESMDVLRLPPIDHLGTPIELVRAFGGKPQYLQALRTLELELYRSAAQ